MADFGTWHAACSEVNNSALAPQFVRPIMFTKITSKLDKSVMLSLVAMLGFNVVVLAQQLGSASLAALPTSASAQQA